LKTVLRGIFGPKMDRVTEGWRKMNNEELHNLYFSPHIEMIKLRRMRWAWHVAHKILVGKHDRTRLLGPVVGSLGFIKCWNFLSS
jgi:hypothetical protein